MNARRAILAALLLLAVAALPAGALAARGAHHRGRAHHHRHRASARLERVRRHPPHLTHHLPADVGSGSGSGSGSGLTAPAPPAGATPGAPPATPSPPAGPARLQVLAREYSFQLSRQTLVAGAAIIELDNAGQDPHSLSVQRAGGGPVLSINTVAAGRYERGSFDLPPGTYRFWCPLGDHDAQGMHATVVVG